MTHPDTKIIQTGLLLIVAAIVVITNQQLFFGSSLRKRTQDPADPAFAPGTPTRAAQ
jgi:hypothetical protein